MSLFSSSSTDLNLTDQRVGASDNGTAAGVLGSASSSGGANINIGSNNQSSLFGGLLGNSSGGVGGIGGNDSLTHQYGLGNSLSNQFPVLTGNQDAQNQQAINLGYGSLSGYYNALANYQQQQQALQQGPGGNTYNVTTTTSDPSVATAAIQAVSDAANAQNASIAQVANTSQQTAENAINSALQAVTSVAQPASQTTTQTYGQVIGVITVVGIIAWAYIKRKNA